MLRNERRETSTLIAIAFATCTVAPATALAVSGRIDVRDTREEGRAGENAYRFHTLRREGTASQRARLVPGLILQLDGRVLDEETTSRLASSSETRIDRLTESGEIGLSYQARRLQLGIYATGLAQKSSGSDIPDLDVDRERVGGTVTVRDLARTQLSAGGSFLAARRDNVTGGKSRIREWEGSLTTRSDIPRVGRLGYRFSGHITEDRSVETTVTSTTHTLSFAGDSRFAAGRGDASLDVRSSFFGEEIERSVAGLNEQLVLPLSGGFVLDDTPETFDPIENDLTPQPALFDRDRATPTAINIGDAAPVVHEFGGDYRNIVYDFGEPTELTSAVLYVDTPLLTPGLIQWRIFATNDPDGRIWEEIDPGSVEVAYHEFATGLQGWTVSFARPEAARHFKMVDVKLGTTIPDLFVTELETFVREEDATTTTRSHTDNHRLAGTLGYRLVPTLRVGYDLMLRRRTFSGAEGSLDGQAHGFSAQWAQGPWSVAGRHEIQSLDARGGRRTDVERQSLSGRRTQGDAFSVDVGWIRNHDRSDDRRRTSNDLSAGASWAPAPRLWLHERVGVGWLRDRGLDERSTAVSTITTVRGQPLPALSVEVAHASRWVTSEAGSGYSRFDDTEIATTWTPVPLISLASFLNHQYREESDWIVRHTVSWTPMPGGSVAVRFSATHLRDTRIDSTQRSGSAFLEWRPRPSLSFEGQIESSVFTEDSETNSPLNTEIRGVWRF